MLFKLNFLPISSPHQTVLIFLNTFKEYRNDWTALFFFPSSSSYKRLLNIQTDSSQPRVNNALS